MILGEKKKLFSTKLRRGTNKFFFKIPIINAYHQIINLESFILIMLCKTYFIILSSIRKQCQDRQTPITEVVGARDPGPIVEEGTTNIDNTNRDNLKGINTMAGMGITSIETTISIMGTMVIGVIMGTALDVTLAQGTDADPGTTRMGRL